MAFLELPSLTPPNPWTLHPFSCYVTDFAAQSAQKTANPCVGQFHHQVCNSAFTSLCESLQGAWILQISAVASLAMCFAAHIGQHGKISAHFATVLPKRTPLFKHPARTHLLQNAQLPFNEHASRCKQDALSQGHSTGLLCSRPTKQTSLHGTPYPPSNMPEATLHRLQKAPCPFSCPCPASYSCAAANFNACWCNCLCDEPRLHLALLHLCRSHPAPGGAVQGPTICSEVSLASREAFCCKRMP